MRIIAMTGTRTGNARASRATIGARGWWSFSGGNFRWTSQTALARRYAPSSPIGGTCLLALLVIGAAIHGMTGAAVALLLALALDSWLTSEPPDGFVCLRCGCEFQPAK
jgi:hypothetical protein